MDVIHARDMPHEITAMERNTAFKTAFEERLRNDDGTLTSKIIQSIKSYDFDEAIKLIQLIIFLRADLDTVVDEIIKIKHDRLFMIFFKKIRDIIIFPDNSNSRATIQLIRSLHPITQHVSANGTILMMKYLCDHLYCPFDFTLREYYTDATPAIAGYLLQNRVAFKMDYRDFFNDTSPILHLDIEKDREIIWSLLERDVPRNDQTYKLIEGNTDTIFNIFDETKNDLKTHLNTDVAGIVHSYLCDEHKEQMNVLDMPNDFDNVD